jgi:hypothetical protein
MARVNIYLPDELAKRARDSGLNVSALAQAALERELRVRDLNAWLDGVRELPDMGITHERVMEALDGVRAESGDFVDRTTLADRGKRSK